jgi:membrane-bound lytic murein transglycosylase
MAETTTENTGTGAAGDKDQFGNFKSEIDRKLTNMADSLKSATETLKQQMMALNARQAPKREEADQNANKKFSEKFYENEEGAINEVLDAREQRIYDNIARERAKGEQIGRLYNDFPELSDKEHPLTKKAVELWESLPKEERASNVSYKAAVLEAATTLGVLPKSKRDRNSVDDYQGGGSEGGSGKRDKEPEIDLEFARKMGLNVDDPKVVERIKGRAKTRSAWGKYQ